MTSLRNKLHARAHNLLQDWALLKQVHYSRRAEFINAVDIEIAKDGALHMVDYVQTGMLNDCPDDEMAFRVKCLEEQLVRFRDLIMIEVLKNGSI